MDVLDFIGGECFQLLNTFADCELPTAADNELVGDVMRKKFALMLECQKSLIYTIKSKLDLDLCTQVLVFV